MSTLQNPLYHRSQFNTTFVYNNEELLDFFGSNYLYLYKNTVKNYSEHTAKQRENLDRLSWLYYDTTSLWWAIALSNDIIHPMQIKTGATLRIPSKADIDAFVLAYRNSNKESNSGKKLNVRV